MGSNNNWLPGGKNVYCGNPVGAGSPIAPGILLAPHNCPNRGDPYAPDVHACVEMAALSLQLLAPSPRRSFSAENCGIGLSEPAAPDAPHKVDAHVLATSTCCLPPIDCGGCDLTRPLRQIPVHATT